MNKQKIVMEYPTGDSCTWWATNTHPIRYESPESALVDFEAAWKKAQEEGKTSFMIFGREFSVFEFEECLTPFDKGHSRKFIAPNFFTVDEWFEAVERT